MKRVSTIIKNASTKIQSVVAVKVGSYLSNCSPASRAAFFAGAAMATGTQSAMAQSSGGGFAGMGDQVAKQGTSIADSAGTLFVAAGFIIASYGALNMYKRSRETRDDGQPQTPVMKIIGPWVAGAALAGTGAFMTMGGESVGIQKSDYGNVPG